MATVGWCVFKAESKSKGKNRQGLLGTAEKKCEIRKGRADRKKEGRASGRGM